MQPLGIATALIAVTLAVHGQKPPSSHENLEEVRRAIQHSKELDAKDSIQQTKRLSASERRRLVRYLTHEWKSPEAGSESELRSMVLSATVALADLDGDGINEVIVQGSGDLNCSPTGNCSFEVLKHSGPGFKKIAAGTAQSFSITDHKTEAFSDLLLGMHSSAFRSDVRLFRFHGGRYRRAACYDVNWRPDPEKPVLAEPIITPCE